jgi:hypothetical protein
MQKSIGDSCGSTHCFIETSGILLAGGMDSSVYSSTNYGDTWSVSNTGIVPGTEILCFGKNSAGIFAGADKIYFSNNNGVTWSIVNSSGNSTFGFAFLSDTVFAATLGGGILRSIDNGLSWTAVNTGISTLTYSIIKKGGFLFAGTDGSGLFMSSNSGASWTPLNTSPSTVRCLETDGINIYAGTLGAGLYISSDNGNSWTQVTNGIPASSYVFGIKCIGNSVLAGASLNGVYRSLNQGVSWTNFSNGMPTKKNEPENF